ncbi:putative ferredoxin reductase [Echinicola pacifica]|uniref:Ferredoxin reductase n=1 Tax=Echinicola pacifica TaxID=346377 RepID=A0A918PVN2_9BACT|nr:FAD-dependent oxidoreductase [Echinicola pacifica]GGZ24848.1 putative ferredoxin reductase [Echinicola pacifica]
MNQKCIIIGASHGGVNCAFALRKEGYQGSIDLIDADPNLPYHRPPLSKTFLNEDLPISQYSLWAEESYSSENINLHLGKRVLRILPESKTIVLDTGEILPYDQVVLATGAKAIMPSLPGIEEAKNLYTLRTAADVVAIKERLKSLQNPEIAIIGAGFIGLETAASLRKLGHPVSLYEREERILSRVAAQPTADYFSALHQAHGVQLFPGKTLSSVSETGNRVTMIFTDGSTKVADLAIFGIGVRPAVRLAQEAGLTTDSGILIDDHCQSSIADIYALGDCCSFIHPRYRRLVRIESVQNAVDQAKLIAKNIMGQSLSYEALPWFWSDQYDTKLQMVGINQGYDNLVVRRELDNDRKLSVWYFEGTRLLAVDAINNAKAYVLGTKYMKEDRLLDKELLANPEVPLSK